MERKLEPLGAPARVRIVRVMRPTYRLEWEFDGYEAVGGYDPDTGSVPDMERARRLKSRTFFSRHAAYRAAALRLIFSKRDQLATRIEDGWKHVGCRLCAVTVSHPESPPQCRYHGGDGFEALVDRLTSWLKWRDSKAA